MKQHDIESLRPELHLGLNLFITMGIKLLLWAGLLLAGGLVAIEEPSFTIESKTDTFEVRQYGPILVAETLIEDSFDSAGNRAFRILADYIFGNNQTKSKIAMTAPVNQQSASQKIAMTAPVNQTKTAQGFLVQFTMPSEFTSAETRFGWS